MCVRVLCGGAAGEAEARGAETVGEVAARALGRGRAPAGGGGLRCRAGGAALAWGENARAVLAAWPGAEWQVEARVRGGGGDGGATGAEDRSAYLSMYRERKPDAVDPAESRRTLWGRCRLSGDPLRQPCVTCPLGGLFNKEAVLEALLARALPPECAHIRGLKDLTTLRLRRNPAAATGTKGGSGAGKAGEFVGEAAPFVCPVTGVEMNGRVPFRACRRTGLVVSARALKEVPEVVRELLLESANGKKGKVERSGAWIPLNGTPEELEGLRERLDAGRAGSKGGKHKRRLEPGEEGPNSAAKRPAAAPGARPQGHEVLATRPKFKAVDHLPEGAGDREAYASIFTSSRKGDEKETFMCRSVSARGGALT